MEGWLRGEVERVAACDPLAFVPCGQQEASLNPIGFEPRESGHPFVGQLTIRKRVAPHLRWLELFLFVAVLALFDAKADGIGSIATHVVQSVSGHVPLA